MKEMQVKRKEMTQLIMNYTQRGATCSSQNVKTATANKQGCHWQRQLN